MKYISLLVPCSITAILIINSSLPIEAAATIPTLKEAITLVQEEIEAIIDSVKDRDALIRIFVAKLNAQHTELLNERVLRQTAENKLKIAELESLKESLKKLYRLEIEEIESNFPHECDDDYEVKKVIWDKAIFKTKTVRDQKEERRRQKWRHYLINPPNNQVKRIVARANKNGTCLDDLAFGIAKAYRFLSDEYQYHMGQIKLTTIVDPVTYYYKKLIVVSLRTVLKEADIMDEYYNIDKMAFLFS